jgi:hypothetical protein
MNCLLLLFIFIVLIVVTTLFLSRENFGMDHYLRPNYETGANMLRGDLPIQPVKQSWFNTKYGWSSLTPGFFTSAY